MFFQMRKCVSKRDKSLQRNHHRNSFSRSDSCRLTASYAIHIQSMLKLFTRYLFLLVKISFLRTRSFGRIVELSEDESWKCCNRQREPTKHRVLISSISDVQTFRKNLWLTKRKIAISKNIFSGRFDIESNLNELVIIIWMHWHTISPTAASTTG